MSLEAAAVAVAVVLICCAVGGAIGVAGVLVGLLVACRSREMPRVKCVVSDWDMTIHEGTGPLARVVCSFEVDMYNEGALATGLREDEAARRTFSTRTPSVRSSTSVRSAEANLR